MKMYIVAMHNTYNDSNMFLTLNLILWCKGFQVACRTVQAANAESTQVK